jgi:transcription elongation factor GreB
MNKAFVKEAEDDEDDDAPGLPPLPAGTRNYITPGGYRRLRAELMSLLDVERPKVVEVVSWAAKNGDRSENGDYLYGKKRLREIDRRIRFLTKRLDIAEVADPSAHHGKDQVFFGATVTYANAAGRGAHRHDQGHRRIRQPGRRGELDIAHRTGPAEGARRRRGVADDPGGLERIEVVAVRYPAPAK